MLRLRRQVAVGLALALLALPLAAAGAEPIRLDVDARDAGRRLLRADLSIPVSAGPQTLVYPRWIPGTHAPLGPVTDLVGLEIRAAGRPLAWQRDSLDLYAFRVTVPDGVSRLDVSFGLVSGLPDGGLASPASLTTELALLRWNQVVLYPAGPPPADQPVELSVRLPADWKFASALDVAAPTEAGRVRFRTVDLDTLVDSPLLAGRHFLVVPLAEGERPVTLAVAGDSAEALRITPETTRQLRNLVAEADALFGARLYRHYTFLVTLSDLVAQFGLESHESSENRVAENAFTNPAVGMLDLPVLAHEYAHSWNGKYRRPAGLLTPDFQAPMRGDLLWVYEGLTQYLGHVLAARSGLVTGARYRDRLAQVAAYYSVQPGRKWRSIADTAVATQQLGRASPLWRSYRRSTDYYNDGAMAWLEADMLIRERTRGRRSLDDFCRAFFAGVPPGPAAPAPASPYGEDDVYAALDRVLPFDWRGFFAARIAAVDPPAPVAGLELGGWRLVFGPERNPYLADIENVDSAAAVELAYSLGIRMNTEGRIDDLLPGSPADAAGLAPGMQVRAVAGRRWSAARLRDAIAAASGSAGAGIPLLVEYGDRFDTRTVQWTGGLREPRLERLPAGRDRLGDSIAPRAGRPAR